MPSQQKDSGLLKTRALWTVTSSPISIISATSGPGKLGITFGNMISGCEEALPGLLVSTSFGSLASSPE